LHYSSKVELKLYGCGNMNNIENNRQKNIYEIVSIVKLICLLFCGTVLFIWYFSGKSSNTYVENNYGSIALIGLSVCTFALIYLVWAFSSKRLREIKHLKRIQYIETSIFIFIFIMLIILSGAHVSQYKFLFLFIIITSTIQSGMKQGVIVACISSVSILLIDLIYGPKSSINQYFENDIILAGVFILTAWPLGYYVKIESEHRARLSHLINIDGLTEVHNHRFFHDSLKQEFEISQNFNRPLSVILVDIDYFKYYNDLYGHQQGDKVLKEVADVLKGSIRKQDVIARYGGEEFAIILPDTIENDAILVAERVRVSVERYNFDGEENQPNGKITVSVGVSNYPNKAKSAVELIKSADDALYKAKFFNKNRVETYYSILEELKQDIEQEHIDLITSIKTLISVINAKDRYTYAHTERVVMYCGLIADKLELDEEQKKNLRYGAYLHDIGKINIPKEILIKKMPLNDEEWEMLKQHPVNGIKIIKPVKSLRKIIPLIMYHHEKYDGTGYPTKLKGDKIPYLTRILTVVDSFDAMTSNRPYNMRKTYEEAILELERCSGTQFDPVIAKTFIEVIKENKNQFDNLAQSR
jgi:diguanylate cyclase (GGDEF)-like protein